MEREKKEKIAVFRFGVIFPLVEKDLREYWGEKERRLNMLVEKEWDIPFSKRNYISRATILSWVRRYEIGGRKIEALFPKERGDRGRMRSLDGETLDALVRLRKENPKHSVPRLVEIAKAKRILTPDNDLSMATIYRLMKRHKVERKKKQDDMRKFEVQMPNDLWQADCMHGPKVFHEGKLRKSYLFAIIDDHSRLIPHAQFYLTENIDNFLDTFWSAMSKRGLPRKLYVDNGPSFHSHRLKLGCASLEIGLSYARPYRPQGKGKIERFFRTVRTRFLPDVSEGISLKELNSLFDEYLEFGYHLKKHGGTGETPFIRYIKQIRAYRMAPSNLPVYFRRQQIRKVNNDRTVKLDGRLFEAPVGLVGQQVILRFENYDRIEVFLEDQSMGFLKSLNAEVNSRVGRTTDSTKSKAAPGGKLFEKTSDMEEKDE